MEQLPIQDRLNPLALRAMQLRIDMSLNEVVLKREWKENKGRIMKSYMDTVSQLRKPVLARTLDKMIEERGNGI